MTEVLVWLAILGSGLAIIGTCIVFFANGMRSSPGAFKGRSLIALVWVIPLALWIAIIMTIIINNR